jgi:1,2-diacylglycerol 3-beta-galactosyltransferase
MDDSKVLLLFSATGGGHRSVAEALMEAFALQAPAARVILVDLFHDCTLFPINRVGRSYQLLVQNAPVLWRAIWRFGEDKRRLAWMMRLCMPLARPARRVLCQHSPDLVISVHPLLNHIPLRFLREEGNQAPFVTVVTDWASVPLAWFCPQVDLCVVPNEAAVHRARAAGLSAEQMRVVGMPVSGRFHPVERLAKPRWRQQLSLDPDQPTVLLVGGGGGVGSLGEIALAVADELAAEGHGQLVVICGRNEHLRQQLAQRMWPIPVTVQGFVTNMPDWMGAADLIITKAGPSTIAEALVVGLPILLCSFIPGQEEGNVPFVVEQGAGVYVEKPTEIARRVGEWLRPGNPMLVDMAARARALGRPAAAEEIAEEILRLLPIR